MSIYKGDDPLFLNKALQSVVSNSLVPNEIVLMVDGPIGSDLLSIIHVYLNNFPSLFFIDYLPRNFGLYFALNQGLIRCTNEYIIRCDADDLNHPDRFKCLIQYLEQNPLIDVIGSHTLEINQDNNERVRRLVPLSHQEICHRIKYRNPMNHMSVAFKKSVVLGVGGYSNIYLREDYELWAKLIYNGRKFANINKFLVYASTGNNFYKRRGGIKYASGERELQLKLIEYKINGVLYSILIGLIRFFIFLLPSPIKKGFYNIFLRRRDA